MKETVSHNTPPQQKRYVVWDDYNWKIFEHDYVPTIRTNVGESALRTCFKIIEILGSEGSK